MAQAPKSRARAKSKSPPPRPPVLEWIMAALGAAVILLTLTLLLKDAKGEETPPQLTAHVVEARPLADGWAAEVEVVNRGDETAARARVALMGSEAETDYVPGHGKARLTLIVPADPAATLPVVKGWSEP
ncbi:MAG TPA: hypothetical protein VGR32_04545 [Brevundimonas sp.]|jgi:uncharacterized protein (TIGR02588 family)|uniref:hypothetical protein n=1 Tax=Brevundimonas sp. TaxID=1871086 RepID=UPI002DEF3ED5|nr:hypothetical protein [Brevundimonas sp.]